MTKEPFNASAENKEKPDYSYRDAPPALELEIVVPDGDTIEQERRDKMRRKGTKKHYPNYGPKGGQA